MASSASDPVDDASYRYDAKLADIIEHKWQAAWQEQHTNEAPNPVGDLSDRFDEVEGRRKFFLLDMFPYPSGTGLHVGHPLGYIGTDVFGRYLRMTGHNVLHTFGYDSFGLPAEQFAINTRQHPDTTTRANIANMSRQLRRLGLAHDQRREVWTSEPGFYRWTQWIFLQLFNSWFDPRAGRARPIDELIAELDAGGDDIPITGLDAAAPWSSLDDLARRTVVDANRLAYLAEAPVNWCPGLGTVLANEEVTADGRSAVGNFPVFRRPLKQWKLRITAYADRLIDDLDLLEWPESIKAMQRNWIGRSEGALVDFALADDDGGSLRVFTTRPDTLFGATFMVVAPEHPVLDQAPERWPAGTPDDWKGDATSETDDPSSPPAAIAAYRRTASRRSERQRTQDQSKSGIFSGLEAVNPVNGERIPVFVADYVLMGYGTGAIMAVPAHDQRDFDFARAYGLEIRSVIEPSEAWVSAAPGAVVDDAATWPAAYDGTGPMCHSGALDGLDSAAGRSAITEQLLADGAGCAEISYRLRDWLFSRQRYWGEPFPIVYDETGLPIGVPDHLLPVELPPMADFAPSASDDADAPPEPPLGRATGWTEVELDLGDGLRTYRRETNTMPQWAGSCWYYLRYLDPTNTERFVDPAVEQYWMLPEDGDPTKGGVDLYVGGVEHAVLHLLYARFWHKVLFDLGHVSTPEPFHRLFNQGYVLATAYQDERGQYVPATEVVEADAGPTWEGQPVVREYGKMGKSLKNSVAPDDIYADYGADTLRLYLMAAGPLDSDRPWQGDDIVGVYRFLQRVWRNVIDEDTNEVIVVDEPAADDARRSMHRTIHAVRNDLERMHYNTAVARLITYNNELTGLDRAHIPRELIEPLVLMLAPFAPHIAEELWSRLGHDQSLVREPFPESDESMLTDPTVDLAVQVNGKVRARITVAAGEADDVVEAAARAALDERGLLADVDVKRVIIVPGRTVNVVVAR